MGLGPVGCQKKTKFNKKYMDRLSQCINLRGGYTILSIQLWTLHRFKEHMGDRYHENDLMGVMEEYRKEFPWTACFIYRDEIVDARETISGSYAFTHEILMKDIYAMCIRTYDTISSAKELVEFLERCINDNCIIPSALHDTESVIRVIIIAPSKEFFRDYHKFNNQSNINYCTFRTQCYPPSEWVITHVKAIYLHGLKTHWCRKWGVPLGTFKFVFESFG